MFVRWVVPKHIDEDSGCAKGVVSFAYVLVKSGELDDASESAMRSSLSWLERHVPIPDRFSKSTSKGYYRRRTRGLSWFRDTATDAIVTMNALAAAVRAEGHEVVEIREMRVGYVTHEDAQQVVAEPFKDTRTR